MKCKDCKLSYKPKESNKLLCSKYKNFCQKVASNCTLNGNTNRRKKAKKQEINNDNALFDI